DVLLAAGDLLSQVSTVEESAAPAWVEEQRAHVDKLMEQLSDVRAGKVSAPEPLPPSPQSAPRETARQVEAPAPAAPAPEPKAAVETKASVPIKRSGDGAERAIKVGAQTFNR